MGVVKYTGPIASFHCPTNAEIRSLKVHFSPKQEGTGDPSPENVRPIVGWDGVEVQQRRKNLFVGDDKINPASNYHCTASGSVEFNETEQGFRHINNGVAYTAHAEKNKTESRMFIAPQDMTVIFSVEYKNVGTDYGIRLYKNSSRLTDIHGSADSTWHTFTITIALSKNDAISAIMYSGIYWRNIQIEISSSFTFYESYHGSTTNYEFGVLGKNKFDKNNIYEGYIKYENGEIEQVNWYNYSDYIPIYGNTLYLWNTNNSNSVLRGTCFYNNSKEFISAVQQNTDDTAPISISIPSGAAYVRVNIAPSKLDEAMITIDEAPTSYEPYNSNHIVYGGWVDLITGEVCEDIYAVDSSLWKSYKENNGYTAYVINNALPARDTTTNHLYLSNIISSFGSFNSNSMNKNIIQVPSYCALQSDIDISNLQWMYRIATPNTYHLAPTQLQTFLGQNNVWSNADYVEIEYDLHETQDILARKQFIIANQPHIESATGSIISFNTDVPAQLKECKIYFNPVQDLHGYSNPWIGGAGKNIWDNNNVIYGVWTASNGTVSTSTAGCRTQDIATTAENTYTIFFNGERPYSASIIELDENKEFLLRTHKQWEGASSPSALTVSMSTNTKYFYAQIYNINISEAITSTILASYKIQLEKGSTATSYEPYENICPISGWTGLDVYRGAVNVWDGEHEPGAFSTSDGTPTSGVSGQHRSKNPIAVKPGVSYYVYCNKAVNIRSLFYDINDNFISAPASSYNYVLTVPSNAYYTRFYTGAWTAVWSLNVSFNYLSTDTDYHEPNVLKIPITFPETKNLFDEKYPNITSSSTLTLRYRPIYVGDQIVTISTDTPQVYDGSHTYSNLFVLPGNVSTGASTGSNDIYDGAARTVSPIDGYITIAYRQYNGVDPRNYHTQIEKGSTATPYEPCGAIYGGYVDLVSGTLVKTWEIIDMSSLNWTERTDLNADFSVLILGKKNGSYNFLCSTYKHSTSTIVSRMPDLTILGSSNGSTVYIKDSNYTGNKNSFISAITGQKIIYELATPITYQLTPAQLKTLRGTNNIWSTANGNIELAYWSH